jgi:hypothetical protein
MDNPIVLLFAIIVTATVAHVFQLWIRHQRRVMVHRERLAALEKGVELPPLEQEIQRRGWNVQRLLLLAGLIWISIGIAAFPMLQGLAGQSIHFPWGYTHDGNPFFADLPIAYGMQWLALAPIGIGLSHVIVYFVGRQKETRGGHEE